MNEKLIESRRLERESLARELAEALGTQILFGEGKLDALATLPLPGKKALVVISKGKSTRANGYLDRLLTQLKRAGADAVVYDRVEANPVMETIDCGGEVCRQNSCDFIVALGGGSVIDSGKMIAIIAVNEGSSWEYVQSGSGGRKPIQNDPLPIVAIPTTAGTGSEVNAGTSFTKVQTDEKIILKDDRLLPRITLIDPELTYSLPEKFAAYQGWDALTHSLENLLNNNEDAKSSYFAKLAVQYAGRALVRAVKDKDCEAQADMALASALSGYAIGHSGTSSQHALECALSGSYPNLPHGAGLLLMSKAYFGFMIEKHACDEIFVELARMLGKADADSPQVFLEAISEIHSGCGMDTLKMSDFGIEPQKFQAVIDIARATIGGSFGLDRYSLTDADCLEILNRSYR